MNSNIVKPEKFDHLHLVYQFTVSLRTVCSYGLNDRIEDEDQCKSGKECEDLIEKALPSLPCILQKDDN